MNDTGPEIEAILKTRGKGDQRHSGGRELPCTFTSVDQLVEDFIAAVDAARRTK